MSSGIHLSRLGLLVAAILFLHPFAAVGTSPEATASPGPSGVTAPCEYKWTFSFHGCHYGIEQYGPVASYPRNTLLIWRNRARLIPITVPGIMVLTGIAVPIPIALFVLVRRSMAPK